MKIQITLSTLPPFTAGTLWHSKTEMLVAKDRGFTDILLNHTITQNSDEHKAEMTTKPYVHDFKDNEIIYYKCKVYTTDADGTVTEDRWSPVMPISRFGGSNGFQYSNTVINTPIVTLDGFRSDSRLEFAEFKINPFSVFTGNATHDATSYRLIGDNKVLWSREYDYDNKEGITLPLTLEANKQYSFEARVHDGDSSSDWGKCIFATGHIESKIIELVNTDTSPSSVYTKQFRRIDSRTGIVTVKMVNEGGVAIGSTGIGSSSTQISMMLTSPLTHGHKYTLEVSTTINGHVEVQIIPLVVKMADGIKFNKNYHPSNVMTTSVRPTAYQPMPNQYVDNSKTHVYFDIESSKRYLLHANTVNANAFIGQRQDYGSTIIGQGDECVVASSTASNGTIEIAIAKAGIDANASSLQTSVIANLSIADEYVAPPVLVDSSGDIIYVSESGSNMALMTFGETNSTTTIGATATVSPSSLPTIGWFDNNAIALVGSNNSSYIIYTATGSVVKLIDIDDSLTKVNTPKRLVTRRDGSLVLFCRTNDNNLAMLSFNPISNAYTMQQIICSISDIAETQLPAIIQKQNGDITVVHGDVIYKLK